MIAKNIVFETFSGKIRFNPRNLFVFDETIMTTESSGIAPEFKTYYDKRLIRKASPNLVFAQFAVKKPLPAGQGKSVEFRGFRDLDTTPEKYELTEGVTPDGEAVDMYTITVTVKQYGNYVRITDMVKTTAIDPMVNETVDLLAGQANIVLDKLIRNSLLADDEVEEYLANNADDTGDMTPEAHKISVADVRKIVAFLKRVNAPKIDGAYPLILHTDVASDLTADEEYKELYKYLKPQNLANGYVGDVVGARIYESTNALIAKDATSNRAIYYAHLVGQGSYGCVNLEGGGLRTIIKQVGSSGAADPLEQKGTIGWKAASATCVLIPAYLINYASCSSLNAVEDAEITIGA